MHSVYDDAATVADAVRLGRHREIIGGLWEEIGTLQFNLLRDQGLQPNHRLLDIGAGSLRLGRLAIPYLDAEHYFATDLNATLLFAGRSEELSDDDRVKFPTKNMFVDGDFDFSFLVKPIDFGMAQSVFSHLPLHYLRRCLIRAESYFRPGGKLFITAFICPQKAALDQPFAHPNTEIVTYDIKDPFHYRFDDFAFAAQALGWRTRVIGDWGHPRGQKLVEYVRL